MDNEAFRYLAAIKSGISFGEDQDSLYDASWVKARFVLHYNIFCDF